MKETTIHNLSRVEYKKITPSMTHEEFKNWIDNDEPIIGFIGGVLTTPAMLDNKVPSAFPNNLEVKTEEYTEEEEVEEFDEETGEVTTKTITVTKTRVVTEAGVDEDGKETQVPVMVKREWQEYVGGLIRYSLDGTQVVLPLGERNKNGNRHSIVGDTELRAWVGKFGIDNILTKSEYYDKLNSPAFKADDGIDDEV